MYTPAILFVVTMPGGKCLRTECMWVPLQTELRGVGFSAVGTGSCSVHFHVLLWQSSFLAGRCGMDSSMLALIIVWDGA